MLQYLIPTDFLGYNRKIRFKVLFFNLASITVGLITGKILDRALHTSPVFVIVCVLLSFPLTVWLIKNQLIKNG